MNNTTEKVIDFSFMQNLFDLGFMKGKGWKSHYFREAQDCFKKHFEPINKWKQNPNDTTKWGHYNDQNIWSWTNRINTHPNCCLSLYNWALKNNPTVFIDFGNPEFHEYNAKRMWTFVDKYFDTIFTKDSIYYNELKMKCQKSWNNGNISMVAIILSLKPFFKRFGVVSDIEYTYNYGDGGDMDGIDLTFKLNGKIKTIQIKSGTYQPIMGEEYYIKGSPNDLEYDTDYYGYVNVDSFRGLTSVIIFENSQDRKKLYKEDNTIIVKNELIIDVKNENMPISEKLNEILLFCSKKDLEFRLNKESDKNNVDVDLNEKVITISIVDFEDKNLSKYLSEKFEELKKTHQ